MDENFQNPEFQIDTDTQISIAQNSTPARPRVLPVLIVFVLFLAAILGGYAIYLKNTVEDEPQKTQIEEEIIEEQIEALDQNIIDAGNRFGLSVFQKVLENSKDKNENILFSPLSISLILNLLTNGASSQTQKAILQTINLQDIEISKINQNSRLLMQKLQSIEEPTELHIANSIWARDNYKILESFTSIGRQFYKAEINNLDFSSPDASQTIDAWVAKNTNNKITKIAPEKIDEQTTLFLLNTLYFNGLWKYEFDKTKTEQKEFINLDNSKSLVDMMRQDNTFRYLSEDGLEVIELAYTSENMGILIVMPQKELRDFISNFNLETYSSIMSKLEEQEGTLVLPKFEMNWESELSDILANLGMSVAFSQQADFSNIDGAQLLKIGSVKQKTFMSLDEKGTEAAAVTSIEMVVTSTKEEETQEKFFMEVNKPFLFVLKDNETNAILFLGAVEKMVGFYNFKHDV
jgi:serine protease inhibitor